MIRALPLSWVTTPGRAAPFQAVPGPLAGVLLALVYLAAAQLGWMLDPGGGPVTLVRPAAGIVLAALLLFGTRLWPGVAVGAFLANAWAGAPLLVACGMAIGSTLGPVLGAAALARIPSFHPSLHRRQDVLALALAASLCTAVGATVGVSSLVLGEVAADRFGRDWTAWWLGDAMGILTLTPAILLWAGTRITRLEAQRRGEALVLAAALSVVGWLVFRGTSADAADPFWQPYMLAPLLIWAVLRFEQRGAATALVLVSAIAIWGTALATAPFPEGALPERLRSLQTFTAVVALTFLVLGAVTAERRAAEEKLTVAKEAAEAANHTKTQFLSVMSHELRTPLTGIIGYAHLLNDEIMGPLNPGQHGQIGRIKASAWHLVHIIESILTFASTEAGHEEINLEDVDAVVVAREALASIEAQCNDKGLPVRVTVPRGPAILRTDPAKLRQILTNLLVNAVKFADAGSIDLTVESDERHILFHVGDHGPGISSDQLEKIFHPFTQVDQSSTREKGGTGLGLAVARSLATLLGGRVTAESTLGAGSTFTLRLPLGLGPS